MTETDETNGGAAAPKERSMILAAFWAAFPIVALIVVIALYQNREKFLGPSTIEALDKKMRAEVEIPWQRLADAVAAGTDEDARLLKLVEGILSRNTGLHVVRPDPGEAAEWIKEQHAGEFSTSTMREAAEELARVLDEWGKKRKEFLEE